MFSKGVREMRLHSLAFFLAPASIYGALFPGSVQLPTRMSLLRLPLFPTSKA